MIRKIIRYSGVLAGLSFLVFTIIASLSNPWFNVNVHSLSHLGSIYAINPLPYNLGMWTTGILILIYGISYVLDMNRKWDIVGGTLIIVSGIFLFLIGLFPMGTKPHNFVSAYFFFQMNLSFLIIAIGLIINKIWKSIPLFIIVAFELVVAGFGKFPSVATVEIFGIFMLFMEYVILLTIQKGK